ncbi:MAG: glycerol-3-phosphate acyltransferase, partial [Candidatus Kapaibacterium sp.]
IDVRTKGSGNMGSTNTFRTFGWRAGLAVQILDILKGAGAVLFATWMFNGNLPFHNATPFDDSTIVKTIAGCCAVIGHVWTIFGGFKGGKGINTAVGMLLSIAPIELAVAGGIFLLIVFASGYVSLGSIIAALTLPTTMFVRYNFFKVEIPSYGTIVFFLIGLALLIVFTHRTNISRLIKGDENRFNKLKLFK